MTIINRRRIWLGALAGGVVFFIWSLVTEFFLFPKFIVGQPVQDAAMAAGLLQATPRIPLPLFLAVWALCLFGIAYGLAWAYAMARATAGAGPGTALKLGLLVGFAAGVPMDLAHAVFQTLPPPFWLGWGVEMLVGSVLAALAAGWVYKEVALT